MAMLTASVEPQRRGGFLSVNAAIQHLAIAVATMIAGLIVDQKGLGQPLTGYPTAGVIAIVATLLSLPLAARLRPAKGGLDAVPEPEVI
jgi:predicted MFS family arabinose efflux permease